MCGLHNPNPWYELARRAAETGSVRVSGSRHMEEKHSEWISFTMQVLESERERERRKNERSGLLEHAAEQSMCF